MPMWLHDVNPLTVAHAMRTADHMRQVDRVIGQRAECDLQPAAFGRIRCKIVDRLVGGQGNIGDRVHALRMTADDPPGLG